MFALSFLYGDWVLLFSRVVLAAVMIAHGWPKIKDLKMTAQNFDGMGFKPGIFWGTVVALVEFAGGLAVLVGFWAELAAGLFAVQMLVATLWKVKNKMSFVGGYELDLILVALAALTVTYGTGFYALQYYLPY